MASSGMILNDFGQRIINTNYNDWHLTNGYNYVIANSGTSQLLGAGVTVYPGISGLHKCTKCKCGADNPGDNALIGDFSDYEYIIESPVGGEITYPSNLSYFASGAVSGVFAPDESISDTCLVFFYDNQQPHGTNNTLAPRYQTYNLISDAQLDLTGNFPIANVPCALESFPTDYNFLVYDTPVGSSGYQPLNIRGYVVCSGTAPVVTSHTVGSDTYQTIDNNVNRYANCPNSLLSNFVRYFKDGYLHILWYSELGGEKYTDNAGNYSSYINLDSKYKFASFYGKIPIPSGPCSSISGVINNELGSIGSTTGIYLPSTGANHDFTIIGNGGYFNIYPTSGTKTLPNCVADTPCDNCCSTPKYFYNYIRLISLISPFLSQAGYINNNLASGSLIASRAVDVNRGAHPNLFGLSSYRAANGLYTTVSGVPYGEVFGFDPTMDPLFDSQAISGMFKLDQDPSNPCKWSYTENPSKTVVVHNNYLYDKLAVGLPNISGSLVSGVFQISLERLEPTWYLYKVEYTSADTNINFFTSYITTKYKKCGLTSQLDNFINPDSVDVTYGNMLKLKNFNVDYFAQTADSSLAKTEVFIGDYWSNRLLREVYSFFGNDSVGSVGLYTCY